MPRPALKGLSIDKLFTLRDQVDAAINAKAVGARRDLQNRLGKLDRLTISGVRAKGGRRGAVAPKYRNPENPAETWAGRGLKPRWLVAAMKGGKKLEAFAIASQTKKAPVKRKKA